VGKFECAHAQELTVMHNRPKLEPQGNQFTELLIMEEKKSVETEILGSLVVKIIPSCINTMYSSHIKKSVK
jgi:hypothetical protein